MLILGTSPPVRPFPLVGEEEDGGRRGGALGTPLGVALLSLQSSSYLMTTRMICLSFGNRPPPLGSDLPLYIEVGRVHDCLGGFAYDLHAPESRSVL